MTTDALRPYVAIISARFRMLLQYRAAAIGGLWTQIFFGLVFLGIYDAFYRSSDQTQPMSFPQVVSYVWLGQAFWAMLPWNADGEVRAMVRSGAVAFELCRPVDLYGLWYARAVAWRTAPTVLRAMPLCLFVTVASFKAPRCCCSPWSLWMFDWSADRVALLFLTVAAGVCMFIGLIILQATSAFWTTETLEVWNAFTYGGVSMSQYPAEIYRPWFRRFFTFVIPLACVNYFPGVAILGRHDPLGTSLTFQRLAPLAGPLFLLMALQVWKIGVRHYRSTGS